MDPGTSTPFGSGKVRADAIPFGVGQVGGLFLAPHKEERMPLLCLQGVSRQSLKEVFSETRVQDPA